MLKSLDDKILREQRLYARNLELFIVKILKLINERTIYWRSTDPSKILPYIHYEEILNQLRVLSTYKNIIYTFKLKQKSFILNFVFDSSNFYSDEIKQDFENISEIKNKIRELYVTILHELHDDDIFLSYKTLNGEEISIDSDEKLNVVKIMNSMNSAEEYLTLKVVILDSEKQANLKKISDDTIGLIFDEIDQDKNKMLDKFEMLYFLNILGNKAENWRQYLITENKFSWYSTFWEDNICTKFETTGKLGIDKKSFILHFDNIFNDFKKNNYKKLLEIIKDVKKNVPFKLNKNLRKKRKRLLANMEKVLLAKKERIATNWARLTKQLVNYIEWKSIDENIPIKYWIKHNKMYSPDQEHTLKPVYEEGYTYLSFKLKNCDTPILKRVRKNVTKDLQEYYADFPKNLGFTKGSTEEDLHLYLSALGFSEEVHLLKLYNLTSKLLLQFDSSHKALFYKLFDISQSSIEKKANIDKLLKLIESISENGYYMPSIRDIEDYYYSKLQEKTEEQKSVEATKEQELYIDIISIINDTLEEDKTKEFWQELIGSMILYKYKKEGMTYTLRNTINKLKENQYLMEFLSDKEIPLEELQSSSFTGKEQQDSVTVAVEPLDEWQIINDNLEFKFETNPNEVELTDSLLCFKIPLYNEWLSWKDIILDKVKTFIKNKVLENF